MIGIIRITTALILDECKPTLGVNDIRVHNQGMQLYSQTGSGGSRCRNVAADKSAITVDGYISILELRRGQERTERIRYI